MKKSHLLLIIYSLFIVSLILGSYYLFSKKDEKVTFGDDIIKNTAYLNDQKKEISASLSREDEVNNEELNKVYSLTRAICSAYSDYSLAVKSRYFTMLKKQVSIVKEASKTDSFNFLYIVLPGIIYESCINKDPEFNEKIVFYLQSENDVINSNLDQTLKDELKTFIDEITFVDIEATDKNKLKSNATYFDDYFFNKNEEELVSVYYPYYIKEGKNISNFLNKPINSLNEEVEFKNKIMTNMLLNIKLLGFDTIEEFKNTLKNNYSITDIDTYKKSLINDYKKIETALLKEGIDLKVNLENINQYKKFIQSGEYDVVFKNAEISQMVNTLGKKMTILTILGNDYADGINETWSGKEFFGSEVDGNNLIRLNFIYILKLNSDGTK